MEAEHICMVYFTILFRQRIYFSKIKYISTQLDKSRGICNVPVYIITAVYNKETKKTRQNNDIVYKLILPFQVSRRYLIETFGATN